MSGQHIVLAGSSNLLKCWDRRGAAEYTCFTSRRRLRVSCGFFDRFNRKSVTAPNSRSAAAEAKLLEAIKGSQRGLDVSASLKEEILRCVEELEEMGKLSITTNDEINATWKLLWTTEKVKTQSLLLSISD
jgi:hypothetical protein